MSLYQPKFPPFKHQKEGSNLLIENEYFALFDEMGTGKSKTVIDACNELHCNFQGLVGPGRGKGKVIVDATTEMYFNKQINSAIIVCPNQVKSQWGNPEWGQIVTHTPDYIPINIFKIESSKPSSKWPILVTEDLTAFTWVVVNYEALRVSRIYKYLEEFLAEFNTAMILDESIYIKNPASLQTRACISLGKKARRRYILNGTPLTKGPLDYFAQFKFLHQDIIGIEKYIVFKNRYAEMGGYKVNGRPVNIVGYQNIPELIEKIKPFYRRVEKKDCLDLPSKLYQVIEVEMSEEQDAIYKGMKDNFLAFINGKTITAPIILTKLLRLSQISAGFISDGEENVNIFSSSPKIEMAIKLVQQSEKPAVIFCMFQPEIQLLQEALLKENISFGEIHGKVKLEKREEYIKNFQAGNLKVMICQVATGGLGIELFAAGTVIRLTSHRSHAIQVQAEDRVHRTGLQHNVTYIDILSMRHKGGKTIDHLIYQSHIQNKDLIDSVLELGELDGQI